jgi:hypothetical protein
MELSSEIPSCRWHPGNYAGCAPSGDYSTSPHNAACGAARAGTAGACAPGGRPGRPEVTCHRRIPLMAGGSADRRPGPRSRAARAGTCRRHRGPDGPALGNTWMGVFCSDRASCRVASDRASCRVASDRASRRVASDRASCRVASDRASCRVASDRVSRRGPVRRVRVEVSVSLLPGRALCAGERRGNRPAIDWRHGAAPRGNGKNAVLDRERRKNRQPGDCRIVKLPSRNLAPAGTGRPVHPGHASLVRTTSPEGEWTDEPQVPGPECPCLCRRKPDSLNRMVAGQPGCKGGRHAQNLINSGRPRPGLTSLHGRRVSEAQKGRPR